MADFITLTDADDGTRRRINANAIAQYFDAGNTLVLSESGSFRATETPEQIDALLAVTGSGKDRANADEIAMALEIEWTRLSTDADIIHNGTMRGDMKLRAKAFRDAAKMARDIIAKGAGA